MCIVTRLLLLRYPYTSCIMRCDIVCFFMRTDRQYDLFLEIKLSFVNSGRIPYHEYVIELFQCDAFPPHDNCESLRPTGPVLSEYMTGH